MAQSGQPGDTTYLSQIATAVTDGIVDVTAAQLAWALGVGGQAVEIEELPDWEFRGRLAVLVLAGVSPAEALVLAGFSPAELLREIADMIDQNPAPAPAPAAPAQGSPLGGLLRGPQPPLPGAVPPPDPTPAPAQPAPQPARGTPPRPPAAGATPKAAKPGRRQS